MSEQTMRLVAAEMRPGSQRLLKLPRWVRPDDAEGYWHIPRSAEIEDADTLRRYRYVIPNGTIRVRFWCGHSRWAKESDLIATPYEGARLCGTCDGRARGFERAEGRIFAPRSPFDPPKICPAMCAHGEERCPFCGAKPRFSRRYCHWDQARHRIGDGWRSWTPCPHHGWKQARRVGDRILCGAHWPHDCRFEIAPSSPSPATREG